MPRALLNVRFEAQRGLGSSEALSPDHRRVLSPIEAAADAAHNVPRRLAEQTESSEVALIGEVTTAKETLIMLKIG
ncbi:hypothetical protein [Gluconobacter wancherniae]|uniref:hypothetical protein n=1 Tax=Gluconobacter wancherniae TaxID=1307955 RepID=UPI001B8C7CA8|nr:hypothetical protein [Gluconobacter wancherniae]MBS1089826.1 hypothetical protein [Gluconobacter wancherniae]